MTFQERLIEASSDLRARASAFTTAALDHALKRAGFAAQSVDGLKGSFATLTVAGRELNKVAQRHASRFVKENSALAKAAGKDFGALARSTYSTLSGDKTPAPTRKPRKARRTSVRKRAAVKAA